MLFRSPHILWVHKNIPLPPTIKEAAIKIIKDQIALGVYEPSTTSYRSHWFCVLKQNGKSWCLVHNLQPLNAVTICDTSLPPFVEHFTESFAGYVVYGMLDLFAGFNQHLLHPDSQDLTSFLSPVSNLCHTTCPMGYTNSVQIYQGNMCFILQFKIPMHTELFLDDIPMKSEKHHHQNPDGFYQTIPENLGIHVFIWKHLTVVH